MKGYECLFLFCQALPTRAAVLLPCPLIFQEDRVKACRGIARDGFVPPFFPDRRRSRQISRLRSKSSLVTLVSDPKRSYAFWNSCVRRLYVTCLHQDIPPLIAGSQSAFLACSV